ncbi:MAG: SAM-dependent methyltransferase [Bacteriovoracia bacterium]
MTSLPDISEFPGIGLSEWKAWFTETARIILQSTPEDGVTIFYQSDIKLEGAWVDKASLVQKAAENLGHQQLWHKIIQRAPTGVATFGRPSYSHMLCFSQKLKLEPEHSTADVIDRGAQLWERGMGWSAARMAAKFIKERTGSKLLINPFCGHGTMLVAAQEVGLDAIGIERSPKRAEKARLAEVLGLTKS